MVRVRVESAGAETDALSTAEAGISSVEKGVATVEAEATLLNHNSSAKLGGSNTDPTQAMAIGH